MVNQKLGGLRMAGLCVAALLMPNLSAAQVRGRTQAGRGAAPAAAPAPAPAPAPAAPAAAPAPVPPATYGTSATTAPVQPRALAAWDQELPSVQAVRMANRGRNPADTVAQQDAAFEVLEYYVKLRIMAGHGNPELRRNAMARVSEYARAKSKPLSAGAVQYLNGGLSYHRAVLSKMLPQASVRAYEATPGYQKLSAAEAQQRGFATAQAAPYPSAPVGDSKPSHDAPLETQGNPVTAPTGSNAAVSAWVSEANTLARANGVDYNVLGIALGQPLTLPPCAAVTPTREPMADPNAQQLFDGNYWAARGAQPEPTQKCDLGSHDPSGTARTNAVLSMLGQQIGRGLVNGTSRQFIYFPPKDRPSWFSPGVLGLASGTVAVILAEGRVVAVELSWLKAADAKFVLQAVKSKYPKAQPKQADLVCTNNYGARTPSFDIDWVMPGLHVKYSLGCAEREAALTFETSVMARLRERADEARMAAEPKL